MDAKKYLKEKFIDEEYEIDSLIPGVGESYFKLANFIESYHQAKSKEEAGERYEAATQYLYTCFKGGDVNLMEALRIASGKEE